MNFRNIYIIISIVFVFFVIALPSKVHAASGSLELAPSAGSYNANDIFDVELRISGGDQKFNAAKANIVISQNLDVEDLTLGDCDLSFVKTPSISSPSFAGVILGSSSGSCLLYTMKVKAIQPGDESIQITDGSIKSFNGANEILFSIKNGSYAVGGQSKVSSISDNDPVPPGTNEKGQKLYDIQYTIELPIKEKSDILEAVMDPNEETRKVSGMTKDPSSPNKHMTIFKDVVEGVHEIAVFSGNREVSYQILNIGGNTRELKFAQKIKPVSMLSKELAISIIVGVIVSIVVVTVIYLKKRNKNN